MSPNPDVVTYTLKGHQDFMGTSMGFPTLKGAMIAEYKKSDWSMTPFKHDPVASVVSPHSKKTSTL